MMRKSVFVAAPPATVWRFLIDADKLSKWYNLVDNDLKLGEEYRLYKLDEAGEKATLVTGRVLEMDEPHKLVTTFIVGPFEGRETTVTWHLEDEANGTRLTLEHEGIEAAAGDAAVPLLEALSKGWDGHLGQMQALV